jgi:hypothetical protein
VEREIVQFEDHSELFYKAEKSLQRACLVREGPRLAGIAHEVSQSISVILG